MAARFSEECRAKYLDLDFEEYDIYKKLQPDLSCLTCDQDIFLGMFFDGTKNNKYSDTPKFAHSNVARLYEVYPGKPIVNVIPVGNEPVAWDEPPIWPSAVPEVERTYYRKVYVPGVGRPFAALGDSGEGGDAMLGLAMARYGEVRLNWALLQVTNQIHAALLGQPMADALQNDAKLAQQCLITPKGRPAEKRMMSQILAKVPEVGHLLATMMKDVPGDATEKPAAGRVAMLKQREKLLHDAIAIRLRGKPTVKSVRLAVYGFSRGAAEARVFCNWLLEAYGDSIAGIPLRIDFLGLFDTVASVGLAQSIPGANGHMAWASEKNLRIDSRIGRCVHLAAAHEVRGSFPLDSVGIGPNCKEVFYPGVHSDVGGGYPPNDQGRALGGGTEGDSRKLSQVPLAQMYRESLMAGVPLVRSGELLLVRKRNFEVHPDTLAKFNAYVRATRMGTVEAQGRMWPTETQPLERPTALRNRHYGYFLAWRRQCLGRVHQLPGLLASGALTHYQDIHDIQEADLELAKELAFVQDKSSGKFLRVDDQTMGAVKDAGLLLLGVGGRLAIEAAIIATMREKQKQWDDSLRFYWDDVAKPELVPLFETLMHDSRAWFRVPKSHEPYRMWGFLRHRRIYLPQGEQEALPAEPESTRDMQLFRQRMQENENVRFQARMDSLASQKESARQRWKNHEMSTTDFQSFDQQNLLDTQAEIQRHKEMMAELQSKKPAQALP